MTRAARRLADLDPRQVPLPHGTEVVLRVDRVLGEGGACGAVDCNDANPSVSPARPEIPGNGIDDDCSASTPGCLTPELAEASVGGEHASGSRASPLAAGSCLCAGLHVLRRKTRRHPPR